MIDLKLTPAGDLDLSGYDLHLVSGKDQVAQRLRIKLRTFLGEWFLDTSKGIPWFTEIFEKPVRLTHVEATLREHILSTPEVTGLESFELDFAPEVRRLSLTFIATSEEGAVPVAVELELP